MRWNVPSIGSFFDVHVSSDNIWFMVPPWINTAIEFHPFGEERKKPCRHGITAQRSILSQPMDSRLIPQEQDYIAFGVKTSSFNVRPANKSQVGIQEIYAGRNTRTQSCHFASAIKDGGSP